MTRTGSAFAQIPLVRLQAASPVLTSCSQAPRDGDGTSDLVPEDVYAGTGLSGAGDEVHAPPIDYDTMRFRRRTLAARQKNSARTLATGRITQTAMCGTWGVSAARVPSLR